MDYDAIFEAYYTQYRAEAEVPASTDDEYIIGIPLANEAINRWSKYDDTMWKELFTNTTLDGTGAALTVTDGVTQYAAPTSMQAAGGSVRVLDTDGSTIRMIPIIEPNEAQFKTDNSSYCYFLGDPNSGFTLVLNPAPETAIIGKTLHYVYYKKPRMIDASSNPGTTVVEMSDPYFIVHRMLANRFRSSRNPYYTSAKGDAEDALRMMQLTNNSGTWADPWSLADNSGTVWGA